jgi:predicted HicB family RNase H-like nuclease
MRKKPPQAEVKITVRLPAAVHAGLFESAKQHDRSLNSEIVHLAKLYLGSQTKEKQV